MSTSRLHRILYFDRAQACFCYMSTAIIGKLDPKQKHTLLLQYEGALSSPTLCEEGEDNHHFHY